MRRRGEAREALSEGERKFGEGAEMRSAAHQPPSMALLAEGRLLLLVDLGRRINVVCEYARKTLKA